MGKFGTVKTLQLILFVLLAAAALITIFTDPQLYQMIGGDPHVMILSMLLWIALGLSFVFLFFDFSSYRSLQRENAELDNAAFTDPKTGIANRQSCDVYIGRYAGQGLPRDMGCITLKLTNLHEINEREGHEAGDRALKAFADILTQAGRQFGTDGELFVGRNAGNGFLVIMKNSSEEELTQYLAAVSEIVRKRETDGQGILRFTAGRAFAGTEDVRSLSVLTALSDRRAGGNSELGDS